MDEIVEEMLRTFNANVDGSHITASDVERWAGSLFNDKFFNDVALHLANGYHSKRLSYDFCDYVVNELWDILMNSLIIEKGHIPEPFYQIYEAFDAGEFHRRSDKTDDPVAEHTDPLIAIIVGKQST